jgi:hypothetical protein
MPRSFRFPRRTSPSSSPETPPALSGRGPSSTALRVVVVTTGLDEDVVTETVVGDVVGTVVGAVVGTVVGTVGGTVAGWVVGTVVGTVTVLGTVAVVTGVVIVVLTGSVIVAS